jgi:hypothetical protein
MPFGYPTSNIVLRSLVGPKASDGDDVQRAVGRPISASVEADGGWTFLTTQFRTDDRGRPTKASPEASRNLASRRGLSENRRPTAPRPGTWRSKASTNRGDARTTELRIRINRRSGGSARCSGSRAPARPRNSCQPMPPSTTRPTPSHITSAQTHRTLRAAAMDTWRNAVAAV